MPSPKKCPGWGAYTGHFALCPNIDFEEAKKQLKTYFEEYQKTHEIISTAAARRNGLIGRLRNSVELWRGKFLVVKHENNHLRKKLNQQQ